MMNQLGLPPDEGGSWKPTRMQQYVYEGLARMVVMDAMRTGKLGRGSLEDHWKLVYDALWDVLRRKCKARRSAKGSSGEQRPGEDKPNTNGRQTFVRISVTDPSQREVVTVQRKPIDWAARKRAAEDNGWRRPDSRDWLDQPE